MNIVLVGLLASCIVGLLCCFYMMYRNQWVCTVRNKLIESDWERYHLLPGYDIMMKKFWVWDIEKFLPTKGKSNE